MFLVTLYALLTDYHVDEFIGFIVIVYVVPNTLLLSLLLCLSLFLGIWLLSRYTNYNKLIIKLCMSILSAIISYAFFGIQRLLDASMVSDYSYFLAIAYSIAAIVGIWFYKLKPVKRTNQRWPLNQ